MKASEYLWLYCETKTELKGLPSAHAKGETNLRAGHPTFESDTTGKPLDEQDVYSLLGRNEKKLWKAFHDGDKERFTAIVTSQQSEDDAYHAQKVTQEAKA